MYKTIASDFVLFLLSKNALRTTIDTMGIINGRAFGLPIEDCIAIMQAHVIETLKNWSLRHADNNKMVIGDAKNLLCAGFGWGVRAEMFDNLHRAWKRHVDKQHYNFDCCNSTSKNRCKSIW